MGRFLAAVVIVCAISACAAPSADGSGVTVTETVISTSVETVTQTVPVTVTPEVEHALPAIAMYACYGETWANLYQWAGRGDRLQGTVTIVRADSEKGWIDPRVQTIPLSVDVSDDPAIFTIGGRTTAGRVQEAVLTIQVATGDGGVSVNDCPAVDAETWNQIVNGVPW